MNSTVTPYEFRGDGVVLRVTEKWKVNNVTRKPYLFIEANVTLYSYGKLIDTKRFAKRTELHSYIEYKSAEYNLQPA